MRFHINKILYNESLLRTARCFLLGLGCPQDTDAEREARCFTPSDSILFAVSEDVFEYFLRPHMTEKIDFEMSIIAIFRNFILLT